MTMVNTLARLAASPRRGARLSPSARTAPSPARLTTGYLLAVDRVESLADNAMRADKTWVLRLLTAARRLTASATRIH